MAYVDDVECLLPLEDVEEFIQMFSGIGNKLGANLNTSKTRIITSTHGKGVANQLLCSSHIVIQSVGASLQRTIKQYSVNLDGHRNDGLRVLGVPIGS